MTFHDEDARFVARPSRAKCLRWFSIRGEGLDDGYDCRSYCWVWRDGEVTVGMLGYDVDPALVAQRRGSDTLWVRAGVGTVLNVEHKYFAAIAYGYVYAFALDSADSLLVAQFNAHCVGKVGYAATSAIAPTPASAATTATSTSATSSWPALDPEVNWRD